MTAPHPDISRAETILSAVLYLMTAYHRAPCPRIAACIAAHLDCLAAHPHVDPTIREVCAGMREEWHGVGCTPRRRDVH